MMDTSSRASAEKGRWPRRVFDLALVLLGVGSIVARIAYLQEPTLGELLATAAAVLVP